MHIWNTHTRTTCMRVTRRERVVIAVSTQLSTQDNNNEFRHTMQSYQLSIVFLCRSVQCYMAIYLKFAYHFQRTVCLLIRYQCHCWNSREWPQKRININKRTIIYSVRIWIHSCSCHSTHKLLIFFIVSLLKFRKEWNIYLNYLIFIILKIVIILICTLYRFRHQYNRLRYIGIHATLLSSQRSF